MSFLFLEVSSWVDSGSGVSPRARATALQTLCAREYMRNVLYSDVWSSKEVITALSGRFVHSYVHSTLRRLMIVMRLGGEGTMRWMA